MEFGQFILVATVIMFTFIDVVATVTKSIFLLNPIDEKAVESNIKRYSIRCVGYEFTDSNKMVDQVWASAGIVILIFPGIFIITASSRPLKEGCKTILKFCRTTTLKYLFKLILFGVAIIIYPIMQLVIQIIAIYQNSTNGDNLIVLLGGLHAIFNTFPHLGLELYMLLNGGNVNYANILSIVFSFILLIVFYMA